MAQDVSGLIEWILSQGRTSDDLGAILGGTCEQLLRHGIPLWRMTIGMPTVDPGARARNFVWRCDGGLSAEKLAHDAAAAAQFRKHPISVLADRGVPGERWNLERPEVAELYPVLAELRAEGATEYVLRLTAFGEGRLAMRGAAVSFATKRPGGFSDAEIATLVQLMPALSLVAYRIGLGIIATEVLGAYLGPNTGRRVLEGAIRRGDSRTLSAAILFADLRGFTSLSETEPALSVVTWLNEHFEAIGDPIAAHGGEILKFLGDGLLAVFAVDGGEAATACGNALNAAMDALAATAMLNQRRAAAGEPVLELDVVLNFGDVAYGNIGTARRLDFTVIGPAVNEASRMEALCDELGQHLLLSETFVRHGGCAAEKLGRFRLRGMARERDIYALASSHTSR